MIVETEEDLTRLKDIGRICATAVKTMAAALEPGITTRELDQIGRKVLEENGAQSAPELCYQFPGATCISVNEEIAHGIPGDRVIKAGDLVNIDVSAAKLGYFGDTGSSFIVPPGTADIGNSIGAFARKNRYTLITNLASHGVGRSLHEEPTELSTWPDPDETRIMEEGLVFTVEPFLSLGGQWAEDGDKDNWTLYSEPRAPTVQFEHTIVVTKNGPLVLTLAD
jgi:methionyl aminopeptidase